MTLWPLAPADRTAAGRGLPRVALWLMVVFATACTRPSAPVPGGGAEILLAAIEDLVVAGEPPRRGYDRAEFEHWVDVDGSGCTVRHRVLAAQATALAPLGGPSGCQVREGEWELVFDGGRHRGLASDIDVDHVVALAEAWDSGAAEWTPERRREFANDPLNLLVADRQVNKDKGDLDAGEWAPSDGRSRCLTAAKMVLTKLRYSLRVDPAERRGLQQLARACDRADQRTLGGFPLPGTDGFARLLAQIRAEVGLGRGAVRPEP